MPQKGKLKDYGGARFGLLVVSSRVGTERARVRCDCGSTKEVSIKNLLNGNTKTCGDKAVHPRGRRKLALSTERQVGCMRKEWRRVLGRCVSQGRMKGKPPETMERKWKTFTGFGEDMVFAYLKVSKRWKTNDLKLVKVDPKKGWTKRNCVWRAK